MARTKNAKAPEVGAEAPEFNLPSAQGGSLRLGMRTVTGPVIVAFFRGVWSEEDVSYFKSLAKKEDEINLALGDVVGVGVAEAGSAREFAKASGLKSHILYDYAKVATPAWGLLQKDKKNGDHALPATFLIDTSGKVAAAWMEERPDPDELLAKVSEITGLPKAPEEDGDEEKPKKAKTAKKADESGEASETSEKPKKEKLSPEEREKRRAERKAARESGEDSKTEAKSEGQASGGEAGDSAETQAEAEKKSEVGSKAEDSAKVEKKEGE